MNNTKLLKVFQNLPTSLQTRSLSEATTAGGSQGIHTQPSSTDSHVNLDIDGDEIAKDVDVRPPGRKAIKEAIRKRKKAAKDGSPMALAMVSTVANKTLML